MARAVRTHRDVTKTVFERTGHALFGSLSSTRQSAHEQQAEAGNRKFFHRHSPSICSRIALKPRSQSAERVCSGFGTIVSAHQNAVIIAKKRRSRDSDVESQSHSPTQGSVTDEIEIARGGFSG
jgi:hypothetical protein